MPSRVVDGLQSPTPANSTSMRVRQWMYIGPIAACFLPHVMISCGSKVRTPAARRLLFQGVLAVSVGTVAMRLVLMAHAGYPGGEMSEEEVSKRVVTVSTAEERAALQQPTLRSVLRGFA